ncbi:MAG: NADH-quinone oxidoreductase subunit J [Actinomycetaceae bacterium]|nr:NADH-quinone oxidoreductase subunit J [Actinomycetaceae bacterium]
MMLSAVTAGPQMTGTGEAVLFWITAIFMIAGALGVLFFKKAAYAALSMVTVMLGLSVLYFAQGAPFMGVVQVVVYTGAIMMLFLFVLMMIGLQATDNYLNQKRSNIVLAVIGSGVLAFVLSTLIWNANLPAAKEFGVDPYTNAPVENLAIVLFQDFWFSMELAAALLVTAAVGAVLLTHGDRLTPKRTQRAVVEAKMSAYAETGRHVGQHTAPGVYARSTAFDVGALSGETHKPVEDSIPRVLRVRGLDRSLGSLDPELARALQKQASGQPTEHAIHGVAGTSRVTKSGAWGMSGKSAPDGLVQYEARPEIEAKPEAEVEAGTEEGEDK